ncbi:uncharacterized protein LOC142819138 [Pelodiscus sinensis]|uniref:uncharacterized protein LOC142819138 n=1 Tax=Pelodiscus sinensis TaxID=13735 RepID=UPI003F6A9E2B
MPTLAPDTGPGLPGLWGRGQQTPGWDPGQGTGIPSQLQIWPHPSPGARPESLACLLSWRCRDSRHVGPGRFPRQGSHPDLFLPPVCTHKHVRSPRHTRAHACSRTCFPVHAHSHVHPHRDTVCVSAHTQAPSPSAFLGSCCTEPHTHAPQFAHSRPAFLGAAHPCALGPSWRQPTGSHAARDPVHTCVFSLARPGTCAAHSLAPWGICPSLCTPSGSLATARRANSSSSCGSGPLALVLSQTFLPPPAPPEPAAQTPPKARSRATASGRGTSSRPHPFRGGSWAPGLFLPCEQFPVLSRGFPPPPPPAEPQTLGSRSKGGGPG